MRDRIDCCLHCEERHAKCRINCQEYKTQRAELDEANAVRNSKRLAERYFYTKIAENGDKMAKEKKKGPHDYCNRR